MLDRWAQGPLMDGEPAAGGGAALINTPEFKAAMAELIKPMLTEAVNHAVRSTKKEEGKGVKAVQGQLQELISSLKPKQAKKLMKRLGLDTKEITPTKTADELAVEAAKAKKTPTDDDIKNKQPDFFKKRQVTEFETRIQALETENKAVKEQATQARMMSQLDRALSDLPWANMESRDMARDYYAPKLKWNDDGELLIGEVAFDKHIQAEIPAKFENLLAPLGKGGSGLTKGQGKPGAIDIDALSNINSTPAEKAEASRAIAAMMGPSK
jgi:hypothetical protein